MQNFLVYKSSAGSGKTYTLMLVYLGIVLRDPSRFRNILAITFTNKAANEIKQRIVSSLKVLAFMTEESLNVKDQRLVDTLISRTNLTFEALKANAARVLSLILHNYGDFSVSTIDSFMHRVIRAFSFDLKLSMNFEVEMNTDLLLASAVDALLADVGRNEQVTGVLVKFVRERAEEDENWQIDRDLQNFARNLFSEDAIDFIKPAGEFSSENLETLRSKLNQFTSLYETEIIKIAGAAMKLIESHGIASEYFSRGSQGIYSYFKKLSEGKLDTGVNSYVIKTVTEGAWLSAKAEKKPEGTAIQSIQDDLLNFYRNIETAIEQGSGRYELYRNLRRNLYPMAVLGELSIRLQAVKKELNVVSIAEFNRIISSIVMNEPVPFIYERTGEKYRHYLIDEFQDTSVLQWNNLLPLLDNALSQGAVNMIVGDGKQAIYRFRNGEVEQFVRLPEVDNPTGNEVVTQRTLSLKREYAPNLLDSNYRSRCEVVDFNNSFFSFAGQHFLTGLADVYLDAAQQSSPSNNGGMVQIEFYNGAKTDFPDYNCKRVLQLIGELQEAGFSPGDITVLCRSNKDSSQVASYLNANDVKVVSSDSLLLQKSPEVNFLINWIGLMADPENSICRTGIAAFLFTGTSATSAESNAMLKKSGESAGFYTLLNESGFEVSEFAFRGLSLYDTIEELIRIFDLHHKSPVYMQFFLDEVLAFSSGKASGAIDFLEYWEQKKDKVSVVLPLSDDAVQVMTIHKSKGLEFPVVIYAFADDSYKLTKKSAWVYLDETDLPGMPVAMLRMEKSLEKTRFAEIYVNEDNKSKLDLLNMVYVAFTRPAERLYVLTGKPPEKEKSEENKSVTVLLTDFIKTSGLYDQSKSVYTFGDGSIVQKHAESISPVIGLTSDFLTSNWQKRLVFAGKAPRVWQAQQPGGTQATGNLLHLALSRISVPGDLQRSVKSMLSEGLIVPADVDPLINRLNLILNHPEVVCFFDSSGQVAAESEILAPGGKSYRPDRVVFYPSHTDVVDYKSGRPDGMHQHQVLKYASLLKAMDYPDVKAWLIYLEQPVEVVMVSEAGYDR